jgi:hypothetical protein
MDPLLALQPVDYLMIGHITQDVKPGGFTLGGTASYSSLTAQALGLRVGIVTAHGPGLLLPELAGIPMSVEYSEFSSTFENIQTPHGRVQYLHHLADTITPAMIPAQWRSAPIVHLGPVAQEIDPSIVRLFPDSQVCLTPQGWMRSWDSGGRVHYSDWPEARYVLEHASAAVLSIEDVQRSESLIEEMLTAIRVLVVTEGANGARLYWNGDLRYFRPPFKYEIEPTGAGDIFAAAFFARMYATRDPWEAARFATLLAANSVTRRGLLGVPTPAEVQSSWMEIISKPL